MGGLSGKTCVNHGALSYINDSPMPSGSISCKHLKEGMELQIEGTSVDFIQEYLFVSTVDYHITQRTIDLEL